MRVIRCDRTQDQLWNAFLLTTPQASFYHRVEWRDVNERSFGHRTCYLAAMDGEQIVGVFPLVQVKSLLFGNLACSLPFVNYGGPCARDADVEDLLLDEAAAVADEWNVDYLEIRSRRDLGDRYPASTHKVSMAVDLDPDPDVPWKGFKTGQRQEIRRAYKHGFSTTFGHRELLNDFYAVLSESWRDLGTPIYSSAYLDRVLSTFPDLTRICIVYSNSGEPAAGALIGVHTDTVEGMWLGMRERFRRQLVGYVLYWELIKDACQRGFRRFHLGRSTADSGGEQFKRKWNATAVQLYWQYVLRTRRTIPDLNPTSSKYQFAIKTWRRLPIPMTQVLGPMIARSIP